VENLLPRMDYAQFAVKLDIFSLIGEDVRQLYADDNVLTSHS